MNGYNRQPNEIGKGADEYSNARELRGYTEKPSYREQAGADEYSLPKRSNRAKPKTDRSKLLLGLLTATVAVTTGASAGIFAPQPKGRAELREFGADYDFIFYHLDVESEYPTELILYNEFTRRVVVLENGVNVGEFSSLQPNREYTFVVVEKQTFGEVELLEEKVSTKNEPSY